MADQPMPLQPEEEVRGELTQFFVSNPEAMLKTVDGRVTVSNPWDDASVEITIPLERVHLVEALNQVILPPRLTAIYHKDSHDLEVIWSPVKTETEERTRAFDFRFKDKTYRCEFGAASDRLLLIAQAHNPTDVLSGTGRRNLPSFKTFMLRRNVVASISALHPTCFWVRNAPSDESSLIELVRNLNFYIQYFDRSTPHILIHDTDQKRYGRNIVRFPFGPFPATIAGRALQPQLLLLWDGVINSKDHFRRFLHLYQVLEYLAFYYLQEETATAIARIVAAPDLCSKPTEYARQILDLVVEHRMNDEQKIDAVVKQLVDPALVWKDIELDKKTFSEEVHFEGGFSLPPLIKSGWNSDDFAMAFSRFPESIRRLRNALVHSREARMSKNIVVGRANYDKLRPWVAPLTTAALQVSLHCDL